LLRSQEAIPWHCSWKSDSPLILVGGPKLAEGWLALLSSPARTKSPTKAEEALG